MPTNNPWKGKKMGGRGCPKCGGFNTDRLSKTKRGLNVCYECEHRWVPCSDGCRGFVLDTERKSGPAIMGCRYCEVPDAIARTWPNAWRAMARILDDWKRATLPESPSPEDGTSRPAD
jgi:hypothetical protein